MGVKLSNRIKPRIIPTLKYFCWQEAECSYSGVKPATCSMFCSSLGWASVLHLFPADQKHCQITCRNVVCLILLWLWWDLEKLCIIRFGLESVILFVKQPELHCSADGTPTTCPYQKCGCSWLLLACVSRFPFLDGGGGGGKGEEISLV